MRLHRHALITVPVVVAGALISTGSAWAGLPSGTTLVPVTADASHGGIDAALTPAASISGKITSAATHKPVSSALVLAYDTAGRSTGLLGYTDATGAYKITALPASASGYAVCVSATGATGGGVSTGYLSRCYKTVAWNGGAVPSGVTRVKAATGQQVTGINVALPSAAAISGTVKSSAGAALKDVTVLARNRATGAVFSALTSKTGVYVVKSLTASSKGYSVCFDSRGTTTPSTRGFLSQCYKNLAWTGGAVPSGATAVSVAAGRTHTGINGKLSAAGAIAGKVVDSKTAAPLAGATVRVLSATGSTLSSAQTNTKGQYVVKSLPTASADRVCVYPRSVNSTTRYDGRCYKNVAWSGGALPKGTTGVWAKVGRTHTGIDLKPVKNVIVLGSIAGTVTDEVSHQPVPFAPVTVFSDKGGRAGDTTTDNAGHYKVTGLPASSAGYVVCVKSPSFSAVHLTGWAPRCYNTVNWIGDDKPPANGTRLPLSPGLDRTGVDIQLLVGGAIDGTVTAANAPSTGVSSIVRVYTTGGALLSTGFSMSGDGGYSVTGLAPSATGYVVCFDGRFTGTTAYLPECYDNRPWSGS